MPWLPPSTDGSHTQALHVPGSPEAGAGPRSICQQSLTSDLSGCQVRLRPQRPRTWVNYSRGPGTHNCQSPPLPAPEPAEAALWDSGAKEEGAIVTATTEIFSMKWTLVGKRNYRKI